MVDPSLIAAMLETVNDAVSLLVAVNLRVALPGVAMAGSVHYVVHVAMLHRGLHVVRSGYRHLRRDLVSLVGLVRLVWLIRLIS
jgi:hypothetical protein